MQRRHLPWVVCGLAGLYLLSGCIEPLIDYVSTWKRTLTVTGAAEFFVARFAVLAFTFVGGVVLLCGRRGLGRWLLASGAETSEASGEDGLRGAHGEQFGVAAAITFLAIGVFAAGLDNLNSDVALTKLAAPGAGRTADQLLQVGCDALAAILALLLMAERRPVAAWLVGDQALEEDTDLGRRWLRFMAVLNTAWHLPTLASGLVSSVVAWQEGPPARLSVQSVVERLPVEALAAVLLGLAFLHRGFLAKNLRASWRSLRPLREPEVPSDRQPGASVVPAASREEAIGVTGRFAQGRDLAILGFALLALNRGLVEIEGFVFFFTFPSLRAVTSQPSGFVWLVRNPIVWAVLLLGLSGGLLIRRRLLATDLVPAAPTIEHDAIASEGGHLLTEKELFAVAGISVIAIHMALNAIGAFGAGLGSAQRVGWLSERIEEFVHVAGLLLAMAYFIVAVLVLRHRLPLALWTTKRSGRQPADGWTQAIRCGGLYLATQAMYALGGTATRLGVALLASGRSSEWRGLMRPAPRAASWVMASLCLLCWAPKIASWIRPAPALALPRKVPRSIGESEEP